MSNPRAQIYQQARPKTDVGFDELARVDGYNSKSVDPRFLRNTHLPVDPDIEEDKRKAYLLELEKWAALD